MLSPEVQAAVDEIRRNRSLTQSLSSERDLWKKKAQELQSQIDAMASKSSGMSDEDRKALEDSTREIDELNDELEGAAKANTAPSSGANGADEPKQYEDPQAKYKDMTPAEIADARGQEKQSGDVAPSMTPTEVPPAPLMPNLAFNPNGSGNPAPDGDGQPAQPRAIETAGGFVISGGGSTQRAPGSRPESPSSSLIVPEDPNAKAPASTADEIKSGLGDSSQNALLGPDGQPVGTPQPMTDAQAKAEQDRQAALQEEAARKAANPLALSDEDLAKQQGDDGAVDDKAASNPVPADANAKQEAPVSPAS